MPSNDKTLSSWEKIAVLVALLLLAGAATAFIGLWGKPDIIWNCGPAAAATATPTPATSATASAAPTASPAASPNTLGASTCGFPGSVAANGVAAFFIVILLILLAAWKELKVGALKLLGTFSSFGPYGGNE